MTYATVDGLVAIVEHALAQNELPEVPTRLTTSILAMEGWGTVAMMNFQNLICSHGDCRYLEYGSWGGRSLIAAAVGNTGTFVGVDHYRDDANYYFEPGCKFTSLAEVGAMARANVAGRNVQLLNMDFRAHRPEPPINVFYYDADHSTEATRDGIVQLAPFLDPAILLVDDYGWQQVYAGVIEGFKNSPLQIHRSWYLPHGEYLNGVFAAVVSNKPATV